MTENTKRYLLTWSPPYYPSEGAGDFVTIVGTREEADVFAAGYAKGKNDRGLLAIIEIDTATNTWMTAAEIRTDYGTP